MDLEDLHSTFKIRQSELNLSINSTWTCKSWIKGIRSIGGHKNFDVTARVKTIQLVDNFKHSSLNFRITFAKTSTSNCIDLIKENNTRLLGPCHLEKLSYHSGTFTDISLD